LILKNATAATFAFLHAPFMQSPVK